MLPVVRQIKDAILTYLQIPSWPYRGTSKGHGSAHTHVRCMGKDCLDFLEVTGVPSHFADLDICKLRSEYVCEVAQTIDRVQSSVQRRLKAKSSEIRKGGYDEAYACRDGERQSSDH